MSDLIREAPFGQIVRWVTNKKYFKYPEEEDEFSIPWESALRAVQNGEKVQLSGDDDTKSVDKEISISRTATEPDLETAPGSHAIRSKSLESTQSWSEGRLEAEMVEQLEKKQSLVIVPTKTNEGITLVDWYTTDDPANPQNWSSAKKAYVTFLICTYTFVVYASSAIYTSSQEQVMQRFGISYSRASLILALYVLGYGVGPLVFSPMSEIPLFGRNIPYISSFALFVILAIPTALIDNYAGLLVLRFLTGFMGSPCLATGGATMQDLYGLMKLPYALTAWVAAAFSAPAIGPLLSGFAVTAENWRWAFWEILWMSGPVWLLWFFTMPETSAANILLRRAQRLRALSNNHILKSQSEIDQGKQKFSTIAYQALAIPAQICFQDPALFFTNLYSSVVYGIYYSYFEAFPLAYIGVYGFNVGELGIVFTCIIVGCVFGVAVYCAYQWFYLEPDIKKSGLRAQEHRLVPALFAVWALPIGLFLFGWTVRSNVHWIVSMIGIAIFSAGSFILFQCIFMYLPLSYPQYAASLFAANDASRSAMAAGSIIYAHPMYLNLGIGRGVSILGGLMVGGGLGVIALWYYGAKLRARSKFASH